MSQHDSTVAPATSAPIITSTAIDRTRRLVDQLDPAIVAQQVNAILAQLEQAKAVKDRSRCKSLRRALRTRDYYLSRLAKTAPAETAPPAETADVKPAKKARAKKAPPADVA